MKHVYSLCLCILFSITALHAQNIGIGTTTPDNSAALDISSSDKGLLIPRVDLKNTSIATPATGLLVFNTNGTYGGGAGLYINTGTAAAPQWQQLVPNGSGTFIRNQATQQTASFNVSGNGVVSGNFTVGGPGANSIARVQADNNVPLILMGNHADGTGMQVKNASDFNAYWELVSLGNASIAPGGFQLNNLTTGVSAITAANNGWVSINNKTTAPTAALDVNGDIKASGSIVMDINYVFNELVVPAGANSQYILSCPAGYQVLSGGAGHRDFNANMNAIQVRYSGPNPAAPSTSWRAMFQNTSTASETVLIWCNCARAK